MVTDIKVKIEKKVASVIGAPCIICGNSDYTVTFTFDAEWATETVKTARFLYAHDAVYRFIDVVFSGNTATVPILSDIDEVRLGVYAGDLRTTTPVRIVCKKSILCAASKPHDEPAEDKYQQLLDTINNLELLPSVSSADAGKALMVREDGHWVVSMPDFIYNQKDGSPFRLFLGTFKDWEGWKGNKTDVLFIPTDDNTFGEIEEAIKSLEEKTGKLVDGAILPQKKLLASNIPLNYGTLTTVYTGTTSLNGKTYEIELPDGSFVKFRLNYSADITAPCFGDVFFNNHGQICAHFFRIEAQGENNNEMKIKYTDNYTPESDRSGAGLMLYKIYEIIE